MPYKDKADQAKAAAAHYQRNKAVIKKRARDWRKNQSIVLRNIVAIEKQKPCTDCSIVYHPEAMEFDHVTGDKRRDISAIMCNGDLSVKAFQEELAKCELVCANCHRVRTATRRNEC